MLQIFLKRGGEVYDHPGVQLSVSAGRGYKVYLTAVIVLFSPYLRYLP